MGWVASQLECKVEMFYHSLGQDKPNVPQICEKKVRGIPPTLKGIDRLGFL